VKNKKKRFLHNAIKEKEVIHSLATTKDFIGNHQIEKGSTRILFLFCNYFLAKKCRS